MAEIIDLEEFRRNRTALKSADTQTWVVNNVEWLHELASTQLIAPERDDWTHSEAPSAFASIMWDDVPLV